MGLRIRYDSILMSINPSAMQIPVRTASSRNVSTFGILLIFSMVSTLHLNPAR